MSLEQLADDQPAVTQRVVVGVDGSPGSLRALEFAVAEARLRGALLHMIHAFAPPAESEAEGPRDLCPALERAASKLLKAAISRLPASEQRNLPEMVHSVMLEVPSQALIEASVDATLLVLGAGGDGASESLALGSVSLECVEGAGCPVVVVR